MDELNLTQEQFDEVLSWTGTGIELAIILGDPIDTFRLRCRRNGIKPKIKVKGATQHRYFFVDGAKLLIDKKLAERGMTRPEINFFLQSYQDLEPKPETSELVAGSLFLIVPKEKPMQLVFFSQGSERLSVVWDILRQSELRHAVIYLSQIYRELVERIYCHLHRLDYEELCRKRSEERLAMWKQAFKDAAEVRVLEKLAQ